MPWWGWLVLFVAAFALMPTVAHSTYIHRVAFDTVLYMLLALGLNVVVGWGGLLDLGFVAFYGIGAYTYAMLSSDKFGIHAPTPVVIPFVIIVGATCGFLVGLAVATAERRLPGDRDALLPPDLPHAGDERGSDLRSRPHGRRQRDPQDRSAAHPGPRPGRFSTRAPSRSPTCTSRSRSSPSSTSRCTSSTTRARGEPGARSARTRSPPKRWACRST